MQRVQEPATPSRTGRRVEALTSKKGEPTASSRTGPRRHIFASAQLEHKHCNDNGAHSSGLINCNGTQLVTIGLAATCRHGSTDLGHFFS